MTKELEEKYKYDRLKHYCDKLEKEVDKINDTTDIHIFYSSYFHPSVMMYEPKENKDAA